MKTANLAIVFTDIKGFTQRTSAQTLQQNEQLLSTHNALLEPLFKAFGGRVIKMIGDAFLVTFESPTSAVLAGVAIQDRLWQHNRGVAEGERLDVRVAINVGEVRLEDGDVFGEPVNIAARVEGIAEAGEVTFTEAVHLAMNKAEVPAVELGEFELKGIPGKVRVYTVPHAPYRIDAPPLPSAAAEPALAQPPFGNLALSRLKDDPYRTLVSPELGQKAAEFATQAATLAGRAVTAVQAQRVPRRPLAIGAGVLALALLGFLLFRGNETERAIAGVASASPAERSAKLAAARALIDAHKDDKERNYYFGELAVASDDESSAVGYYAAAARGHHRPAENRLIDLLEHPKCGVRSAAADTLADLRLTRAKSAVETLAKRGGPDDGEQVLFFGCDSKTAAAHALRRLEQVK